MKMGNLNPPSIQTLQKKQLEAQLLGPNRALALAGIAHDLNNILTPILAVAQLLQLKFPMPMESQQMLEMLESTLNAELL